MSVNVTVNGTSYTIPQTSETGWGTNVTTWIQGISSSTLQKNGGTFTLTAEADFGASFGIKTLYLKSETANIATTGVLRLANADTIVWRNAGNSADLALGVDSSNRLLYNGTVIDPMSFAAVGTSPNANGGTVTAGVITLQPADATNPGVLSNTTQTIAGAKTFSSDGLFNGRLGVLGLSTSYQMIVNGVSTLSGTIQRAIGAVFNGTSAATSTLTGFTSAVTQADSTTTTLCTSFTSLAFTKGSGSTITRFIDFLTQASSGATNSAVLSDNTSFTGNYFLNASSSNPSVLTGSLTASNVSGTNTGDITLASVGSSPAAAGASIASQVLTLQPADGTHPGLLTSGTQTIGGAKTFSSTIAASNLSGTNTGDQTITLTGDVTGSGTGSFAATVASGAVTLAKMANLAANSIIGNNTGSGATPIALSTAQVRSLIGVVPTVQKFTSGSGTYTTPTSPAPLYIQVTMVGGGSGGGGTGSSGNTAGGSGGSTTFGTSFLTCTAGGNGGTGQSGGTAGGTATIAAGATGTAISGGRGAGGAGGSASVSSHGGQGGNSAFGGAGNGGAPDTAGGAGATNSGSGGGGGGNSDTAGLFQSATGGAAGGYIHAIVSPVSATYAYAVGAGGSGGTGGTGGNAGGAGGSGYIIVEEFYQ